MFYNDGRELSCAMYGTGDFLQSLYEPNRYIEESIIMSICLYECHVWYKLYVFDFLYVLISSLVRCIFKELKQ